MEPSTLLWLPIAAVGASTMATAPGRQVGFNIWTIASTLSVVGVLALAGNAARLLWRLVAETVRSTPTDEELARPLRL